MNINRKTEKVKQELSELVDCYTLGMCTAEEVGVLTAVKVRDTFESSLTIQRKKLAKRRLVRIMKVRHIIEGGN